jgi:hypothetical protein
MEKKIDAAILRAINGIFEYGVEAVIEQLGVDCYTEEQWDEIEVTFDEMYREFMYKC